MDIQRFAKRFPEIAVLIAALAVPAAAQQAPRFYPDDPACCALRPRQTPELPRRNTDAMFDFFYNSFLPSPEKATPSRGVNTLGEVLDSEWFTNRHGRRRMSVEELRRGPGSQNPPRAPYTVVGAKLDGITPGFQVRDSKDDLYFVKPDPLSQPEMATAADVIGAHFFYALGYNTPQNYIVNVREGEIQIGTQGTVTGENGKPRPMRARDVKKVLWKCPRNKDGTYRLIASRAITGTPIGPFRYLGTRSDDPNDIIPHEDRRDLRALHVFCAWLNHTDAKSVNSLDNLVEEDGVRFVRHYLIDFGAILGSDSDMPKNARFGYAYIIPEHRKIPGDIARLGLAPKPFETASSPKLRGAGRFFAEPFDPEQWVSNYPNPAFVRRQPDDEYWAAKQVMAFTNDDIRAIVETGQYSDPRTVDYLTRSLAARRDAIGRTYFRKVLPLDGFRVENGILAFDDLAIKYGLLPQRSYSFSWNRFNNLTRASNPLSSSSTAALPNESTALTPGDYLAVRIAASNEDRKTVTAYLRKSGAGTWEVVGIERTW